MVHHICYVALIVGRLRLCISPLLLSFAACINSLFGIWHSTDYFAMILTLCIFVDV